MDDYNPKELAMIPWQIIKEKIEQRIKEKEKKAIEQIIKSYERNWR